MRSSATSTLRRMPLLTTAIAGALLLAVAFLLGRTALESEALRTLSGTALVLTCVLIGLVAHRQSTELRNLAQTDHLTGLTNHRGFHELLTRELVRAQRDVQQLSLVSIDLDDFKAVNDAHGHPYGDRVLKGVGAQLRGCIRDGDTAARVGGEEFALILPATPSEAAYGIAERARTAISRVPVHGMELHSSAGIATYPADAEDAATLHQFSDGALYWAKTAGKQRTRRFDADRVKRPLSQRQSDEISALLERPGGIRPVVPTRGCALHRPAGRLRGAGPLPLRARPPDRGLVRNGPRLRPRPRSGGRSDPGRAGATGAPTRYPPGAQREPLRGALRRGSGCPARRPQRRS